MWKRFSIALLALGLLVGCKETKQGPDQFYQGVGGITVIEQRLISLGESAGATVGGGATTVSLVRFTFKSPYYDGFAPRVQNFVLIDPQGVRYRGVDSGSSAFVGISNDFSPLKMGAERTFTIGFRITSQTTGTIAYEF